MLKILKMLLAAGADVNSVNKRGETPLYRASRAGRSAVVKLLLAAGADVNKAKNDREVPIDVAKNESVLCMLLAAGADANKADNQGYTPLYRAAIAGQHELVKQLLTTPGIDIKKTCKAAGWRALHLAATTGHVGLVKQPLSAKAGVNKEDKDGNTPLTLAASYGHGKVVELLLSAKADVNKTNRKGLTPLYLAASAGHSDVVKLLLSAKADVNKADTVGKSPLYVAAKEGHGDVVKLLLAAGADVDKAEEAEGETPLYAATGGGHCAVVKLLLAAGADVNKPNKRGWTPLFSSSVRGAGYIEVVKLLLDAGADVNKCSPIERAVMFECVEIVKLLLDAGADINTADEDCALPLISALRSKNDEGCEIVKHLLAAGADVNVADRQGDTALLVAIKSSRAEVVKHLLSAPGIDINKTNEQGNLPLVEAFAYCHDDVIKQIINMPGIDVNKADKDGVTPLLEAVDRGRTEIVKLLLSKPGIDINKANKYGYTPLYMAVWRYHIDSLKLLLAAGADVNKRDKRGKTPIQSANDRNGSGRVIRELFDAAASPSALTPGKVVFYKWEPSLLSEKEKELKFSLPASYLKNFNALEFCFERGNHALKVNCVRIEAKGKTVQEIRQQCTSGDSKINHIFKFRLPENLADNTSCTISISLRCDGGTRSFGTIYLHNVEPEQKLVPKRPVLLNAPKSIQTLHSWNTQMVEGNCKELKYTKTAAYYRQFRAVEIRYERGNHRLEIEGARFEVNGKPVLDIQQKGYSGTASHNNIISYSLPDSVKDNEKCALILRVYAKQGGSSFGSFYLIPR